MNERSIVRRIFLQHFFFVFLFFLWNFAAYFVEHESYRKNSNEAMKSVVQKTKKKQYAMENVKLLNNITVEV